jgi:acetyltransferase-like isoleucine patch superfamily enzyme
MSEPLLLGEVRLGVGCVIQDGVIIGSADGVVVIGDGATIRSGTVIYPSTRIGHGFRTGHNVLIRENTVIGNYVLIGTNAVVDGNCKIGDDVSVQTNVYITTNTTIEDGVFMGPCSVTSNDKYMVRGAKLIGPLIKKGARIGANATILPGVVVGEGAVVGAGSVVTRDVGDGETVVGNPARRLG